MKKTTHARYTSSAGNTLAIRLRTGSNGFNVSATLRTPGERAKSGCMSSHETEAAAKAAFDALKADAVSKGWAEQARKDRSAFVEIPPASPARKGR